MEENVQRIFSIMIAVIVFFLLPMYVAYEKKDDTAYALAVKITSELVENVRNNGYLSRKMYDDYVTKLSVTGNTYEIKIEHKAYKYNPVICSYEDAAHTKLRETFEYGLYKNQYAVGNITYKGVSYGNLVLSYSKSEEVYTEAQILDVLSVSNNIVYTGMNITDYANVDINTIPINPNIYASGTLGAVYTMNKGDSFTIRLRNTNTTVAEIFFNALTVGMISKPIPRVYVNYGCTIQSEKYKTWVIANNGYTGSVQIVTINETGNYSLEVWGASGGNDAECVGGKGGYAKGKMFLTKGTKLYVYVGGAGKSSLTNAPGGWNGGGNAGPVGSSGGGGGATDIRLNGQGLNNRIIVAGGGGGAGHQIVNGVGGTGGGTLGGNGTLSTLNGASQFSGGTSPNGNGTLGQGASHNNDGGGGGGGYYGGGAGNADNGGGGGSGYVGGVSSGAMLNNENSGNGSFVIKFIS
jgi:hypothetical protein